MSRDLGERRSGRKLGPLLQHGIGLSWFGGVQFSILSLSSRIIGVAGFTSRVILPSSGRRALISCAWADLF